MALRVAAVGLLSRVLHERREHFHTLRLGARSLQPAGAFLCRESPSTISPIYRRSSPVTRAGLAGARKSPATASVGPRLLRLLVGARRDYACARANNSADEAVGSRERRACRKGNEEGGRASVAYVWTAARSALASFEQSLRTPCRMSEIGPTAPVRQSPAGRG